MGSDTGAGLRYVAYGAVLAVGTAAYWWLDAQTASPSASRPAIRTDLDMLPVLKSLDGSGEAAARRDLFAYAEPERPPEAEAPPPPPVETAQPQPSQLDDINVVGLVRRSNALFVFVQTGDAIRSVALGGKFGEGDSLTVRSVQGRDVTIVDTTSDASRVFTLSEE